MKYRKRPVIIEAVQFDGSTTSKQEIQAWMKGAPYVRRPIRTRDLGALIEIETLEGTMTARNDDWIIKGVQGEFYPCKPDIFEQTYEVVDD